MSAISSINPGSMTRRSRPVIPTAVLGMLLFVLTEIMFFMALLSAFTVIRAQVFGVWAPPAGLRLPVLATAFNTVVLLTSGALMALATKAYAHPAQRGKAQTLYLQSVLLGAFFVAFQGYEWVKLISYGMTMTSGQFGATFFLIIGSHGLHAFAAVLAMFWLYGRMRQGKLTVNGMRAMLVFWLFVVGIWPLLYGIVYWS